MERLQKIYEYLDWYTFVNESEVSMAIQDYMMEEEDNLNPSMWDCIEAWEIANKYIKERGLKFEPDLVITIDTKKWELHLSDLNNQYNEKQIERMEKIYNNAFLNACDCLKYWYGKSAWNDCWLEDEEARKRVWDSAYKYLCNDF